MTSTLGDYSPDLSRLRVWWIPQVPGKAFHVDVPDLRTGVLLTDTLAAYDRFQYEHRIKPDYCNVGGIEYWDAEEQEWLSLDENEIAEALA